jgi:gliding motility-associated-like protein
MITPQRCGSANGSVVVGNIPNGTAPFNYQLTNLATGNLQSQISNSFNNLTAANYLIQITDAKGCQWQSDTLFVPMVNDMVADFSVYTIPWAFPFSTNPMGVAPLTVYTQNSSVNVNSYEWTISQQSSVDSSQDTIAQYSSFNTQHPFENGGTFEICLFAYNNIVTCGDTVCKTISISPAPAFDSLVFVVPNVFSPNHDGNNDNFVLQVQGVDLLESLGVEIFNRWGMEVGSRKTEVGSGIPASAGMTELVLWDGRTTSGIPVPEGTYFYVITYTKLTGETESLKGSVTLLR